MYCKFFDILQNSYSFLFVLTIYAFFFFNDPATTEISTLSLPDALPISLVVRHVAPDRHEVTDVVGEEVEPLLVPALVEQLGLAIQELFDLALEEQPLESEVEEFLYRDRKSTRLNSSHGYISYAVFCLKK